MSRLKTISALFVFTFAALAVCTVLSADPDDEGKKPKRDSVKKDGIEGGAAGEYGKRFGRRALLGKKKKSSGKELSKPEQSALDAGIRWLVRHQDCRDGKWDGDDFKKNCKDKACTGKGASMFDEGLTGLAVLALIRNGHTHRTGRYMKNVNSAVKYLFKKQLGTGQIGNREGENWFYNHLISTLALCELCTLTGDAALKPKVENAVKFILKAQNPGMGWKYEPMSGKNDTSVTGWAVQALFAAKKAGIDVPERSLDDGLLWFDRVTARNGRTVYMTPGDRGASLSNQTKRYNKQEAMTAMAVVCRILAGHKRKRENIISRGIALIEAKLPNYDDGEKNVNQYYWFHATNAMFLYGGDKWKKWQKALNKTLTEHQVLGGCADGSWDPVGEWGIIGGRVYSTAMGVLALGQYSGKAVEGAGIKMPVKPADPPEDKKPAPEEKKTDEPDPVEKSFWDRIVNNAEKRLKGKYGVQGAILSYHDYIRAYPKGFYIDEALKRKRELEIRWRLSMKYPEVELPVFESVDGLIDGKEFYATITIKKDEESPVGFRFYYNNKKCDKKMMGEILSFEAWVAGFTKKYGHDFSNLQVFIRFDKGIPVHAIYEARDACMNHRVHKIALAVKTPDPGKPGGTRIGYIKTDVDNSFLKKDRIIDLGEVRAKLLWCMKVGLIRHRLRKPDEKYVDFIKSVKHGRAVAKIRSRFFGETEKGMPDFKEVCEFINKKKSEYKAPENEPDKTMPVILDIDEPVSADIVVELIRAVRKAGVNTLRFSAPPRELKKSLKKGRPIIIIEE